MLVCGLWEYRGCGCCGVWYSMHARGGVCVEREKEATCSAGHPSPCPMPDSAYPADPAPASCDFLNHAVRWGGGHQLLETRAHWANEGGVGYDMELRLPRGWPKVEGELHLQLPPGERTCASCAAHDHGVLPSACWNGGSIAYILTSTSAAPLPPSLSLSE